MIATPLLHEDLMYKPYSSEITGGIIGWWKLNGNALDSTSNGYNGTLVASPPYVTGQNGIVSGALSFNGSTQDVTTACNVQTVLGTTGNFSINIWTNIPVLSAVAANCYAANNGGVTRFYLSVQETGGSTNVKTAIGSWNTIYSGYVSGSTWQMWTVTLSGTSGSLYRNASLIGSQAGITVNNPNAPFYIGGGVSGAGWFNGYIDDVRFYNRPLTINEITTLYKRNAK